MPQKRMDRRSLSSQPGRRRAVSLSRRSAFETLESRAMLAADLDAMQVMLAMDVDGDLFISASDVLGVVNQLNTGGAVDLQNIDPAIFDLHRLDADRDGHIVPKDALNVINKINLDGPQDLRLGRIAKDFVAGLTQTQKANLEDLFKDANTLRMNGQVAPDQVVNLVHDLKELAHGTTTPSASAVQALADDVVAAAEDGALSDEEVTGLKNDLQAVFQSATLSPEQIAQVVTDLRAIVEDNGITLDDVKAIAQDIRNIVVEFQNHHAHQLHLQDVRKLLEDIGPLLNGQTPTTEQIGALANDLQAVLGEEHQPDSDLVTKFGFDYFLANLDGNLSDTEIQRLTDDLIAVIESTDLTPELVDALLVDVQDSVATLAADDPLRAIADELNQLIESSTA